jgi:hypothetical protein
LLLPLLAMVAGFGFFDFTTDERDSSSSEDSSTTRFWFICVVGPGPALALLERASWSLRLTEVDMEGMPTAVPIV